MVCFQEIVRKKLGGLLSSITETDIDRVKMMLELANLRNKLKLSWEKKVTQLKHETTKREEYTQAHNLWKLETGYRDIIDEHVLNVLVLAVLAADKHSS